MRNIEISQENAEKALSICPEQMKDVLNVLLGQVLVVPETNLVTSFEQACGKEGYNPATVIPDMSCYPEKHRKALAAAAKLLILTDVVREGHVFNYQDREEDKRYPVFDLEVDGNNPSGFRFDAAYCDNAYSGVGARLSLRSTEEVEHMVKYFEPIYKDWITQ